MSDMRSSSAASLYSDRDNQAEGQALLSEKEASPKTSTSSDFTLWQRLEIIEPDGFLRDIEAGNLDAPHGTRRRLINLLLPSFLHLERPQNAERGISQTAYLDGLRGMASFFVYVRHFAAATHPNIQPGFGSSSEDRYVTQLPFVRLVISGPAMVALFFIVSGYALSWAPLRAQSQGSGAILERLSSSIFRRATRLFLPGVVSTFLVMVCIRLHLYSWGHAAVNAVEMPGFHEPEPPQLIKDALSVQLVDWTKATWQWVNIWNTVNHPYDVHLWTLPVEFRFSMALFMLLAGTARIGNNLRLFVLAGGVVYGYLSDSWAGFLFFAGGFLAQLKFVTTEENCRSLGEDDGLPFENEYRKGAMIAAAMEWLRYVTFVAGLYLLSAPDSGFGKSCRQLLACLTLTRRSASNAPGYISLSRLNPSGWYENWRFPHCVGALLTVYALSSTKGNVLRSLFTNRVALYLGRISYALYLVHGPVVHMLGFWLVPWFWGIFGKKTTVERETGFACAFVIVTLIVLYVSDLFWRGVDKRCVQLAKWIENKAIALGKVSVPAWTAQVEGRNRID